MEGGRHLLAVAPGRTALDPHGYQDNVDRITIVGRPQHPLVAFDVQIGEVIGKLLLGEQHVGRGRAANSVVEVFAVMSDEDQPASGGEGQRRRPVNRAPQRLWELQVEEQHEIPGSARRVPCGEVNRFE